jgi:hypothetical protein
MRSVGRDRRPARRSLQIMVPDRLFARVDAAIFEIKRIDRRVGLQKIVVGSLIEAHLAADAASEAHAQLLDQWRATALAEAPATRRLGWNLPEPIAGMVDAVVHDLRQRQPTLRPSVTSLLSALLSTFLDPDDPAALKALQILAAAYYDEWERPRYYPAPLQAG